MENPFVFAPVLSTEEWQKVPTEIGKTIVKFVNEKFEEFITSKALLETKTFNLGMYTNLLQFHYLIFMYVFKNNVKQPLRNRTKNWKQNARR